jgi:hypothetical protein
MTQILANQIQEDQIPDSQYAFTQFILAIQDDNVGYANLFQTSDITVFPATPAFGGILKTRKGSYDAQYTDAVPEVGQWRRLSDNTVYAVGATIPTTL